MGVVDATERVLLCGTGCELGMIQRRHDLRGHDEMAWPRNLDSACDEIDERPEAWSSASARGVRLVKLIGVGVGHGAEEHTCLSSRENRVNRRHRCTAVIGEPDSDRSWAVSDFNGHSRQGQQPTRFPRCEPVRAGKRCEGHRPGHSMRKEAGSCPTTQ